MVKMRMLVAAALAAGCATHGSAPAGAQAQTPPAAVHPSTAELVQARQAGMHMAATLNAQGVGARAKGNGDLKDTAPSEGLEMWAAAIPGLFPPGSAHPQSRAKPEIWANKADFDARARAMGQAAARVTAAGKAGDLAAYAAAAEQLNQACKACHTAYRGPPIEG
jgi:cytochrome c556